MVGWVQGLARGQTLHPIPAVQSLQLALAKGHAQWGLAVYGGLGLESRTCGHYTMHTAEDGAYQGLVG